MSIREALSQGSRVEIFVFRDTGLMKYGGFHLNLAAGLEDSLVRDLTPPWNGGRKDAPDQEQDATIPQPAPLTVSDVMPTDELLNDQDQEAPLGDNDQPDTSRRISTADFRGNLERLFVDAALRSLPHLDVNSGELNRLVGGQNQFTQVCSAMRSLMRDGDAILVSPPKGNSSRLIIRYRIPRGN